MRQWIREHPWRLEIVPFAFLVSAVVGPLINPAQVPGYASEPALGWFSNPASWLVNYIIRDLVVLSWWMLMMIINHNWIRLENGKTYNTSAPALTLAVAIIGSPAIFILTGSPKGYPYYNFHWQGIWILVVIATGAVEALIERFRPAGHVMSELPRTTAPISHIVPGEPFYYRDAVRKWWQSLGIGLIGAVALSGFFWLMGLSIVFPAIASVIMITFFATSFQSVLVVTNERVTVKVGYRKLNLPVDKIRNCTLYQYTAEDACGKIGDPIIIPANTPVKQNYVAPLTSGNCVKVETEEGNTYIISARDPEAACKLINTAIAARQKSEGGA
ncbi:MAG: hypothetical protein ABFD64_10590 [Armatimonadota bacterium]